MEINTKNINEVKKTDEEIPYIMEDIILKVTEKPYYARENTKGINEFEALAMDKAENIYLVTWLARKDWDSDTDIKEQQESDRYLEELFNTCDIWFYSDGTLYNRTVEE